MKRVNRVIDILIMLLILQCSFIMAAGTVENHVKTNISLATNKNVAVVVKKNSIWAIDIEDSTKQVELDKEGEFISPIISLGDGWVAYTKNKDNLYIANIDFKNVKEPMKVSEKIASYTWDNKGNLIFSRTSGGIYTFNINDMKQNTESYPTEEFYMNMVFNGGNKLFAEKYTKVMSEDFIYNKPLGIVQYDFSTGNEKTVVAYIPQKYPGDVSGLDPRIAGMSHDGTELFVWCRPNSASISADGVPLGYYDIEREKFTQITNTEIIALAYKDNISPSPKSNVLIALINGNMREMNKNKTLGLLDIRTEKFIPLTEKGKVAMTPCYSKDSKRILYSGGKEDELGSGWFKPGHNQIYEITIKNKEIKKLTNSQDGFDFYPKYIDDDKFVFVRWKNNNQLELVKSTYSGNESVITKDILYSDDYWYYGHYNIEKVLDIGKMEKLN